jgi:3-phytase
VVALLVLAISTAVADGAVAESPERAGPVVASIETPALFDDEAGGDADADDPAIWLHPRRRADSLVITTAKSGGINVYNLDGHLVQHIDVPEAPGPDDENGRFNNVDVVYDFDADWDIVVVADRGRDQIRTYRIRPDAVNGGRPPLVDVTAPDVPFVHSADQAEVNDQKTAYGLAAYGTRQATFVFVSRADSTEVAKLRLVRTRDGVSYREVGRIALPAQFDTPAGVWTPCQNRDGQEPPVKGMVVDAEHGVVYLAQEQIGIWRAALDLGRPRLIDRTIEFGVPYDRIFVPAEDRYSCEPRPQDDPGVGGQHLSADVGALTIYDRPRGKGYLLASSQGNNTFAVYNRRNVDEFVGRFVIGDGPSIDGTQESDGAMVLNVTLGPLFPQGLFVAQDTENTPAEILDGEERSNTNFKFVPWEHIARSFAQPLAIDTGGSPRH